MCKSNFKKRKRAWEIVLLSRLALSFTVRSRYLEIQHPSCNHERTNLKLKVQISEDHRVERRKNPRFFLIVLITFHLQTCIEKEVFLVITLLFKNVTCNSMSSWWCSLGRQRLGNVFKSSQFLLVTDNRKKDYLFYGPNAKVY